MKYSRKNISKRRRKRIVKSRSRKTFTKKIYKNKNKKGGDEDGNNIETECGICLENKELCKIIPCKHQICKSCASKITKCPFCRGHIQSFFCPETNKKLSTLEDMQNTMLQFLGPDWEVFKDVLRKNDICFKYTSTGMPALTRQQFHEEFPMLTFEMYKMGNIWFICLRPRYLNRRY